MYFCKQNLNFTQISSDSDYSENNQENKIFQLIGNLPLNID